ncbi:MAG: HEPN domain-containing protein [Coriobacteriales bacterium]|jgi:HEPN domain-containing protein|nr:HEPN domain-containing protein [Coriobacteriales bacterium]
MDAQEKYDYWLDIAQYDLETASAMFDSGRWLYVVFMCEQAVEKLVKGLYVLYIDDNIPRVHVIRQVIKKYDGKLPAPVNEGRYRFFDKLSAFYLEGRYADYKQKLSALVDKQEAENVLEQTREVFAWLLTLKP